jgi:hypothetical protein
VSVDRPAARREEGDAGDTEDTEDTGDAGEDGDRDVDAPADAEATELAARVDVLAEENRRLREEYARARRARHRRTALALLGVGALAGLGGLAFPDARTVLFALSGTGVFAGVLTYYLSPERFVSAGVGEGVYRALAANGVAIATDLGLQDDRLYVPTDGPTADAPARLFVPQHAEYDVPDRAALDGPFVVTDAERSRGVALSPTGGPLFDEFERALSGDLRDEPAALAAQLADGLTEQFELVERTRTAGEGTDGRLSVGVAGGAYDPVDRFDHPVPSFLGVGLAVGLDRPVAVETTPAEDDRVDVLVTCSWDEERAPAE